MVDVLWKKAEKKGRNEICIYTDVYMCMYKVPAPSARFLSWERNLRDRFSSRAMFNDDAAGWNAYAGKSLPFFLEQALNDTAVEHVQMLLLCSVQDDKQGGIPICG